MDILTGYLHRHLFSSNVHMYSFPCSHSSRVQYADVLPYTRGAEIAYQLSNSVTAFALLVHRHSSSKEGSAGLATLCDDGEPIRDFLLPIPPRMWCKRAGVRLKTWATTLQECMEALSRSRVFGCARWRKDWMKASSEFAQDRRVPPSATQCSEFHW